MQDDQFLRLVEPFYLHFMNGNIVSITPPEERRSVMTLFAARLPEYSDDMLGAMFATGGWREAKVAAWAIAAGRRFSQRSTVARLLAERPGYAEHLCLALERLGGEESAGALIAYLVGCADGSLQRNEHDETVSPEWALSAMQSLDSTRSTLAQDHWERFVARQVSLLQESYRRRAASVKDLFPRATALLDEYFEEME
jgi:hypothetical protein